MKSECGMMNEEVTPGVAGPGSSILHSSFRLHHPASPCHRCFAACCRQNGHDFAAILTADEARRFAAYSVTVTIRGREGLICERVLPYVDGKCQFLGSDDRCTIYEDRPAACRAFECAPQLDAAGPGLHGEFLRRNPRVLLILQGRS